MDATGLTALIETGEQLFVLKLFVAAIHCVWIYDYFLTLGDEITYAWNGKRSWVFALFIANRYTPVLYIVWFSAVIHGSTSESFCQNTKWLPELHATLVLAFSKIAITLRVYAVTQGNKWLAGALSCLIAAQAVFGINFIVWIAARPTQQIPAIDLDPFRICISQPWKFGQLFFVNISVAFDVLAFLSILIAAKKYRNPGYPGIPSLLDVILRDATVYFIFMALCQLSSDLFLWFAPSSVQAFPGLASVLLVPLMASRLMLSLKKSAVEPKRVWSLSTLSLGMSIEHRSLGFTPRASGGSGGVPGTLIPLSVVEGGRDLNRHPISKRGSQ